MSNLVVSNTDMNQKTHDELQDQNESGFNLQTNEGDLPGLTEKQSEKPLMKNSSIKEDSRVSEKPSVSESDEVKQPEDNAPDSNNQLAHNLHGEAFQRPDGVKGQHLQVYTQEFHVQTPVTPQPMTGRTVASPNDDISPTESVASTKPDSVLSDRQGGFAPASRSTVRICLYHKLYNKWYLNMNEDDDNQTIAAYAQHFSSDNRPSIFYLLQGISFGPEYDYVLRRKHWWNPLSEKDADLYMSVIRKVKFMVMKMY
ncbi:meiotically upregulated Mug97 [Schizosaccharomyces cryophilus OY26]|uniref:Meiotically upregulated Mug97 n=1 Tax=Schizosaccharomyces cryophilus (strain OY26 / ATCC MYA-4695 / CBS 11777 / NBRC 106824 / NRRL Y48691) TaxID=653667 RepID=S9VTQ1_SCHCR|nr:meiotically upregulated Mug97 [Schizosaccharomyces cryophilus OY26]EPY49430.1 meiotically upregulated Mug97 [Schizosaccharomyces cryophilus OY26]